jgi:hypothetical protein
MFISVSKFNTRYAFIIGENPTDHVGAFLHSVRDFRLIPEAAPTYQTFAEAHAYGSFVIESFPNLLTGKKLAFAKTGHLSPEDSTVETLEEQPDVLDGMLMKIKGALEHERADQLDALIKIIEQAKKGVKALLKEVDYSDSQESLENTLKRLRVIEKSAKRERNKCKGKAPQLPPQPTALPAPPQRPLSPLAQIASPDWIIGIVAHDGSIDSRKVPPADNVHARYWNQGHRWSYYLPDRMVRWTDDPEGDDIPIVNTHLDRLGYSANGHKSALANRRYRNPQSMLSRASLMAFGEAAALSLYASHPESYLERIEFDKASNSYLVVIAEPKQEICLLSFNTDLMLDGIFPTGNIAKQAAYHSHSFFERYWEPIVDAVGHYRFQNVLILPHHPQSKRRSLAGWDMLNGCQAQVALKVSSQSDRQKTWFLRCFAIETDKWENAQVRCIKKLPSYYLRTGISRSATSRGSYLDVPVDFGRGLGVVIMTDSDLEYITKLEN